MSRRLAWSVLPAIVLVASVAGASTPAAEQGHHEGAAVFAFPAASAGDRLMHIASTDLTVDRSDEGKTFPILANGSDTPAGDLGLAAAALANGPVAAGSRHLVPGAGQAMVTAKSKARLPEPATWLMLIGGMYGIGAALRRRHRASEAAFTAKLRSIAAGEDTPEAK